MRRLAVTASLFALLGAAQSTAADSIFYDGFDDPATLADWQRVNVVEGWDADQLEFIDIDATREGWLTLVPYSSSWYEDYRGVLMFREVTGDFIMTLRIDVSNRAGTGPPESDYSLAGIMVRTPRNITPGTWTADGENYVFLSIGAADRSDPWQHEVKTTIDGTSTLFISEAPSNETEIRAARLGGAMIMMRREPGESWIIHQRFPRSDFPAELQVGITVYTDWDTVSGMDPFVHNGTVVTTGDPDLRAQFDYASCETVTVPEEFDGLDLTDPGDVSDMQLISFLGGDVVPPMSSVSTWLLF